MLIDVMGCHSSWGSIPCHILLSKIVEDDPSVIVRFSNEPHYEPHLPGVLMCSLAMTKSKDALITWSTDCLQLRPASCSTHRRSSCLQHGPFLVTNGWMMVQYGSITIFGWWKISISACQDPTELRVETFSCLAMSSPRPKNIETQLVHGGRE